MGSQDSGLIPAENPPSPPLHIHIHPLYHTGLDFIFRSLRASYWAKKGFFGAFRGFEKLLKGVYAVIKGFHKDSEN